MNEYYLVKAIGLVNFTFPCNEEGLARVKEYVDAVGKTTSIISVEHVTIKQVELES